MTQLALISRVASASTSGIGRAHCQDGAFSGGGRQRHVYGTEFCGRWRLGVTERSLAAANVESSECRYSLGSARDAENVGCEYRPRLDAATSAVLSWFLPYRN